MKGTLRLWAAIGLMVAAAACSKPQAERPAASPINPDSLALRTLARGAYSGIGERQVVLISDRGVWEAHWQRHAGNLVPVPPAPAVDFVREAVVAAYMGEQRTGGYSVEITRVTLDGKTLRVRINETSPGPGAVVTQALTQPFHLAAIPRVPPGTVVEPEWQ